jgi:hypothetical protein
VYEHCPSESILTEGVEPRHVACICSNA